MGQNGLTKQPKVKEIINKVFQGLDLSQVEKRSLFGNKSKEIGFRFLQSIHIESFVQKVADKYPGFSYKSDTFCKCTIQNTR